jgi:hypothetical protein
VPFGEGNKGIEIDALAVKMHGNDRFGSRRDGSLDLADVHQEVILPDVDEYRARSEDLYRGHRRHRRVRHRNDFIARRNAGGRQRNVDCIGPAVYPDAAADADIGRHVSLERDPFRPEDQLPGLEDTVDGRENLVPQFVVLASVIPERRQHILSISLDEFRASMPCRAAQETRVRQRCPVAGTRGCRHFVPCS